MKSQARLRLRRPESPEVTMPYVNGKRFYCLCGVGIFIRTADSKLGSGTSYYTCNGCGTMYEGRYSVS